MDTAARLKAVEDQLRAHVKLCATCSRAKRKVDQYCDLGYQIARAVHQKTRQLARERAESAAAVQLLPGMENLGR